MTIEARSPLETALGDVRALLKTLMSAPLTELYLHADGIELFIAKDGGGGDPMRVIVAETPTSSRPDLVVAASPPDEPDVLRAPHVGTIAWLASGDETLALNATAVKLQVLDETSLIAAPRGGRVARVLASVGDLVDFGAPLLELR